MCIPGELGAGRFAHIGLPFPHVLAPFVGAVEIAAGGALILSFYAGDAALLLLVVILTAILRRRCRFFWGIRWDALRRPKLDHYGVLSFIHEARTDSGMLFGLVAILLDSGVKVSLRKVARYSSKRPPSLRSVE